MQQWVTGNEQKQVSEPISWAPTSLGGPEEEETMTWILKESPPAQAQGAKSWITSFGETRKTLTPRRETKDASQMEEAKTSTGPTSCIPVKEVGKHGDQRGAGKKCWH